eukprot:1667279-Pyramimonas_sp.AAC.1
MGFSNSFQNPNPVSAELARGQVSERLAPSKCYNPDTRSSGVESESGGIAGSPTIVASLFPRVRSTDVAVS